MWKLISFNYEAGFHETLNKGGAFLAHYIATMKVASIPKLFSDQDSSKPSSTGHLCIST